MIVGVSATQKGMTREQRVVVRALIEGIVGQGLPLEGHHGDCIGGDAEFHEEVRRAGGRVVLHPPDNDKKRAFCYADHAEPPLPYLKRNKVIVDVADVMWFTPKETSEPKPARGQGTWSTVRYARKRGVTFLIIWPDGSLAST